MITSGTGPRTVSPRRHPRRHRHRPTRSATGTRSFDPLRLHHRGAGAGAKGDRCHRPQCMPPTSIPGAPVGGPGTPRLHAPLHADERLLAQTLWKASSPSSLEWRLKRGIFLIPSRTRRPLSTASLLKTQQQPQAIDRYPPHPKRPRRCQTRNKSVRVDPRGARSFTRRRQSQHTLFSEGMSAACSSVSSVHRCSLRGANSTDPRSANGCFVTVISRATGHDIKNRIRIRACPTLGLIVCSSDRQSLSSSNSRRSASQVERQSK